MSSLKTFSDIHACLSGAVHTSREALDTLHGTLPVATPDDLDHTALTLTFAAALIRRCAHARRQIQNQPVRGGQWWE